MTNILGYLIQRDNRNLFIRNLEEAQWALSDEEYNVTPLVAITEPSVLEEGAILPNTDDRQERLQIMEELFEIQEAQIALLKGQLEKFVEVVEGIIELTEVVSHSPIEARSKLLVISESCKEILKPSE